MTATDFWDTSKVAVSLTQRGKIEVVIPNQYPVDGELPTVRGDPYLAYNGFMTSTGDTSFRAFQSGRFIFDFSSGFQELVKAYKELQVPQNVTIDFETSLAIEAEEDAAPEIDYTTIKQYLDSPKGETGEEKTIGYEGDSFLMLDFSGVKELIPPALPKVTTTYATRGKTTVENQWHFMLLQFQSLSYGLGILFFLPGTELWYYIDVIIPEGYTSPDLSESDPFLFPLDLIAWQIFDFFAHRIANEKLYFQEGFAPCSLSCPDETLATLLSGLFLDLGLSTEQRISTSKHQQIPMKYREKMVFLPNRNPEWVPLGGFKRAVVCYCCFRLSTYMDKDLGVCNSCSKSLVDHKKDPKSQEADHSMISGTERGAKGAGSNIPGKPRFAISYLQRLLYFTKRSSMELVEKRKQANDVSKRVKDLRVAKRSRKMQGYQLELSAESCSFDVGKGSSSRQDIQELRGLVSWDHAELVGSD